jgi:hypothetical protein
MSIAQILNLKIITPLAVYSLGMAVYALFIWHFYRFLARKDIFNFHTEKYTDKQGKTTFKSSIGFLSYLLNYVIIVPISTFLWFAILSAFILFMAKSQPVNQILLVAMAIIAATRITAYYNEDLSRDMAKMLPFTLLGIFIIDPSFFSLEMVLTRIKEVPTFLLAILNYIVFTVALEFTLRLILVIKQKIKPTKIVSP